MVLEFWFGHSKCHFFGLKDWHFWQKWPFSDQKKWHFEWPNQNSKTTFTVQTFPKYGPYDFYFVNVWTIKVFLEFWLGHSKCLFLWSKNGHFCQKCPSLRPKKWHFEWPNQNSRTTFIVQTFPKYDIINVKCQTLSVLKYPILKIRKIIVLYALKVKRQG